MDHEDEPAVLSLSEGLGAEPATFVGNLMRGSEGAPCKCNGYADQQEDSPTPDEIKRYDCGRRYACCTAVFKCRLCGSRFIGGFEAPEINW